MPSVWAVSMVTVIMLLPLSIVSPLSRRPHFSGVLSLTLSLLSFTLSVPLFQVLPEDFKESENSIMKSVRIQHKEEIQFGVALKFHI